MPFIEVLTTELSIHMASKIKSFSQELDFNILKDTIKSLQSISIKGFTSSRVMPGMGSFVISKRGILPMDFDLLFTTKPDALYIDACDFRGGAFNSEEFTKICSYYLLSKHISYLKKSRSQWVRRFFQIEEERKKQGYFVSKGILLLPVYSRRILIKKSEISDIVGGGYVPQTYWNILSQEWENEKWAMLKIGSAPEFKGDIEQLCKELDNSHSYGFYVYYLDWTKTKIKDKAEMSPFAKAWLDINDGQAVLTQKKKEP